MKDSDVYSGLCLIVFSLFGFYQSSMLIVLESHDLSAAFYPNILFSIMITCGIILVYQGWKREKKVKIPDFHLSKLLPITVAALIYAVVLEYTGFIIATLCFLLVSMLLFGEKRPLILTTVTLGATFGIYFLFSKVFMIVMP